MAPDCFDSNGHLSLEAEAWVGAEVACASHRPQESVKCLTGAEPPEKDQKGAGACDRRRRKQEPEDLGHEVIYRVGSSLTAEVFVDSANQSQGARRVVSRHSAAEENPSGNGQQARGKPMLVGASDVGGDDPRKDEQKAGVPPGLFDDLFP